MFHNDRKLERNFLQRKTVHDEQTSMSSLCLSSGASMILRSWKFSFSTSNVCPVKFAILSQCRSFMALLAISSNKGQHSLKSSIVFFSSRKASHSFKALGSLRHLSKYNTNLITFKQNKQDLLSTTWEATEPCTNRKNVVQLSLVKTYYNNCTGTYKMIVLFFRKGIVLICSSFIFQALV